MIDHLSAVTRIAGMGLNAQSVRLRVVSENIANAYVAASAPDGQAYKRKAVQFSPGDSNDTGLDPVVTEDARADRRVHEPSHPAADTSGYVNYPNIDVMLELADMKEANRSYLANLQVLRQAREAINATLDLLRS